MHNTLQGNSVCPLEAVYETAQRVRWENTYSTQRATFSVSFALMDSFHHILSGVRYPQKNEDTGEHDGDYFRNNKQSDPVVEIHDKNKGKPYVIIKTPKWVVIVQKVLMCPMGQH